MVNRSLILFLLFSYSSFAKDQGSLLNMNQQLSEDLRKQKLEEKTPKNAKASEHEEEPESGLEMDCSIATNQKSKDCVAKIKTKKVFRPDGLQLTK